MQWFAQRILDTSTQTNLLWRGARLADRAADDGRNMCVDCRVSCRGVLEEMHNVDVGVKVEIETLRAGNDGEAWATGGGAAT